MIIKATIIHWLIIKCDYLTHMQLRYGDDGENRHIGIRNCHQARLDTILECGHILLVLPSLYIIGMMLDDAGECSDLSSFQLLRPLAI